VLIGSHYLGELEWTWENSSLNRRRYDSVGAAGTDLEKFYHLKHLEVGMT